MQHCREVASLQIIIKKFESQQELAKHGDARVGLLSFDPQRRGTLTQLFRKDRMIDIDADSNNDVLDGVSFRLHL